MRLTSKSRGNGHYLYRAVDSEGNTLDWMLSSTRYQKAAIRFFKKLSSLSHSVKQPRVISTDKNAAYPPAFKACKEADIFVKEVALRYIKYLNNIIKQDHRFVKKRAKSSLWF